MSGIDNFIIEEEITLEVQEGNPCCLSIEVPAALDITNAEAKFQIFDGISTYLKKDLNDGITKDGQVLNIDFTEDDTNTDGSLK